MQGEAAHPNQSQTPAKGQPIRREGWDRREGWLTCARQMRKKGEQGAGRKLRGSHPHLSPLTSHLSPSP